MFRWLKREYRSSAPRHLDPLLPMDRLLSLMFVEARETRATAIVFGMPRELPRYAREHPEALREILEYDINKLVDQLTDSVGKSPVSYANSKLRGAAGWKNIPTWLRIDGELRPTNGPPLSMCPWFLTTLDDRLVTSKGTVDSTQPERFVEFDSDDAALRRLAEIEWWIDEDNTYRIEIVRWIELPK